MKVNFNQYLKAIVGVIGAVLAGLQEAFPGAHWVSLVSIAVTPVLVYLVPNTPAPKIGAKAPAAVKTPPARM